MNFVIRNWFSLNRWRWRLTGTNQYKLQPPDGFTDADADIYFVLLLLVLLQSYMHCCQIRLYTIRFICRTHDSFRLFVCLFVRSFVCCYGSLEWRQTYKIFQTHVHTHSYILYSIVFVCLFICFSLSINVNI